jgi:hypothetical protein
VTGDWVMRCQARTLDDIRALGGNDAADERRFATAARVSEANLALYRAFAQPMVRAMTTAPMAEWMQKLHPLRLQYELLSDASPVAAPLAQLAQQVHDQRQPVRADNPFMALERSVSHQIVATLDAWRDFHDSWAEWMFLSVYGSPWLQAAVGIGPADAGAKRAPKSSLYRSRVETRIAELRSRITQGSLRECLVRAMLYVGMPRGGVDERGVEALRNARPSPSTPRMTLSEFKAMVREQYFMLLIDQDAALAAIPALLPSDLEARRKGVALLQDVLTAPGELTGEAARRMKQMIRLFEGEAEPGIVPTVTELPRAKKSERTKAS